MAATIYRTPAGLDPPEPPFDAKGHYNPALGTRLEAAYIARLRDWLRVNGYTGELAGTHVMFPRGDGYARYLVMSLRPLRLMHLPLGDAWDVDKIYAHGLRADDIRRQASYQEKLGYGGMAPSPGPQHQPPRRKDTQ